MDNQDPSNPLEEPRITPPRQISQPDEQEPTSGQLGKIGALWQRNWHAWREAKPIEPREITPKLHQAMENRRNQLSDAHNNRILPNQFTIEISYDLYENYYQSLEPLLCNQQWPEIIRSHYMVLNRRSPSIKYRFVGPVNVTISPIIGKPIDYLNIEAKVHRSPPPPQQQACLQLQRPTQYAGKQWEVTQEGVTLIGRDPSCAICLAIPNIDVGMISGRHAYIVYQEEDYYLYDGQYSGQVGIGTPSTNDTFVGGQKITTSGYRLQDGDEIILAPPDPNDTSIWEPGTFVLTFHMSCQ